MPDIPPITEEEETRATIVCAAIRTALESEPDHAVAALGLVRALSRHYGTSETMLATLRAVADIVVIRAEFLYAFGDDELATARMFRSLGLPVRWE